MDSMTHNSLSHNELVGAVACFLWGDAQLRRRPGYTIVAFFVFLGRATRGKIQKAIGAQSVRSSAVARGVGSVATGHGIARRSSPIKRKCLHPKSIDREVSRGDGQCFGLAFAQHQSCTGGHRTQSFDKGCTYQSVSVLCGSYVVHMVCLPYSSYTSWCSIH